jgi:protein SCO1/2
VLLVGSAAVLARDGPIPSSDADHANPNVRYEQRLGEKVPLDLTFVDENGADVTLGDCIGGKPTILIMAYYRCPMLCGEVLTGVLDAARKLRFTCGKEFNIVAVSFDPKEKPALALAKKRYFVTEYGRKEADAGWKFLTGQKDNIDKLTAAVGFHYEYDAMLKEYNHPSGILVVTPDGTIARYFPGIEYLDRGDNGDILADPTKTLRLTLVEAGEGKIGSFSDKTFLSCYRYNPHTGKYSLSVMWIMRAGGLLTLLIIAGIYARVAWKLPGARVLVVGILVYAALLPVIMFTSFSVDSIPRSAARAAIIPVGLIVFFVGRWVWKSARAERPAPPLAAVE